MVLLAAPSARCDFRRCAEHIGVRSNVAASAPPWVESELNRTTSAAIRACLSAGGHVPSGDRVTRPWHASGQGTSQGRDAVLDLCAEGETNATEASR